MMFQHPTSGQQEVQHESHDGQVEHVVPGLSRAVRRHGVHNRPAQAESPHHSLGQGQGQSGRIHGSVKIIYVIQSV